MQGIAHNEQRLIFQGKVLKDENKLEEYGECTEICWQLWGGWVRP